MLRKKGKMNLVKIEFLKDMLIAYDGIHVVKEKKGNQKDVESNLADDLLASGSVKKIIVKEKPIILKPKSNKILKFESDKVPEIKEKLYSNYEDKQIKGYENKSIKSYENKIISPIKRRGRPKKV